MWKFKKLAVCILLAASFVVPAFFIKTDAKEASAATTPTGYTKASDVDYVKSGKYVANWGARDEDCVFLTTYAQSFYTGSYVYDTLSQTKGGTGKDSAPSSALYKSLQTLMSSKQTYQTSYNATRDLFCYTDCLQSSYSQISSFYSGKMISGTWDSGKTWNREHTWPNSKGDASGNGENDIMMLRPTSVSENSSRGNKAYGEPNSSTYYDPNSLGQSVRGDCARILLYVYVRWGNTVSMWGSGGVIENLTTLLRWIEEDPVDTWEMGRNDAVQSITGTRNVFVDYPEYAWLLFGQTMPKDMVTPSGEASDGTATPSDSSSSSSSSSIEDSSVDSSSEENTDSVKDILDALYALKDGASVTGEFTLTGKITSLDGYHNPTIVVEGYESQPVYCYRLQLPTASVGDVITVTATTMKNYGGKYEFMNCTLVENQGGGSGTVTPPVDSSEDSSSVESSKPESSSPENSSSEVVTSDILTLTFDDEAKRTSFSADVQVWEENGIKLTNNKGGSSSNVADYSNPARFYKSSELIIECASMGKIVFNCNTAAYATALKGAIPNVDGGSVEVNAKELTVTFTKPVDIFKIDSLLGGQVRVDSITVYVVGNESDSADSSEFESSSEVIPPVESDSSENDSSSEVIPPVESDSSENDSSNEEMESLVLNVDNLNVPIDGEFNVDEYTATVDGVDIGVLYVASQGYGITCEDGKGGIHTVIRNTTAINGVITKIVLMPNTGKHLYSGQGWKAYFGNTEDCTEFMVSVATDANGVIIIDGIQGEYKYFKLVHDNTYTQNFDSIEIFYTEESEIAPPVDSSEDSSIEDSSSVVDSSEESSVEDSSVDSSEIESSEDSSVDSSEIESSEDSSVDSSEIESSEDSSVDSSEEESSEDSSVDSSEDESSSEEPIESSKEDSSEQEPVESSKEESSEEASVESSEEVSEEASTQESVAPEASSASQENVSEQSSESASAATLFGGCASSLGASMGGALLLLTACAFVYKKKKSE